jgi:membrane protein DedA with SNARE-associated domain
VAAGVYAGTSHKLDIWWLVAAGSAGAILGASLGFLIGQEVGFPLLRNFGSRIGLTDQRIKIGQYLFTRYGALVVFAARYLALLRSVIGLLAGINRMKWSQFMIANAAGAIAWSMTYALGGYYFGTRATQLSGRTEFLLIAAAGIVVIIAVVLLRRYEKELSLEAEKNSVPEKASLR